MSQQTSTPQSIQPNSSSSSLSATSSDQCVSWQQWPWIYSACEHAGGEVNYMTNAPGILFAHSLLLIIVMWIIIHWIYKLRLSNKDSVIESQESRLTLRHEEIIHLKEENHRLSSQKNEQTTKEEYRVNPMPVENEQHIEALQQKAEFAIEEMKRELRYKEEGKDGTYTLHPHLSWPENTTHYFLIIATIKSSPPLVVRDVTLEITSPIFDILQSDWMFNQTISHGDIRVSFDVNSLPPNAYSMKLVINQDDKMTSDLFTFSIPR